MSDNGLKQFILNEVSDLAAGFLFYDRKEDHQVSEAQLDEAIKTGVITIDEIVAEFRRHIEQAYK